MLKTPPTLAAELSGKTGVSISAPYANENSRILLSTTDISSENGKIKLQSYGDQFYYAGQGELYTFDKRSYKTGKWYKLKHVTEIKEHKNAKADPVSLSASQGIEIKSGGNIGAHATLFDAPRGSVKIEAGRGLVLYAVEDLNYDKLDTRTKRKFIGITYDKVHDTTTHTMKTALPSRVVAESANLQSGWDAKLQGTQFETTLGGAAIRAGVGDQARADAKIILEGIKSSVRTETVSSSKSALWQKQAGRGSNIETLQLPSFTGSVAPVLSAPGGYIVDIPKGNLKTEIEKLAKQPEYAYLKQLQVAKNVNWNQVQLAYDKWDYKQEGLTRAGAAIIALAVTVVTAGAGVGAALGLNGAAAAAADAAFASLASQASVSLINNKGDVGKTLKELGRSRTVKNLVVAAATAGVSNKLGASSLATWSETPWVNNLNVNLANAGSAALINTAVNGGSLKDNLEANILAALVNTAHGEAASKIKGLDQHYVAHKIAHAVAGCAAAAANKGKCQDGAIGAAVGEIVGEALVKNTDFSDMTPEQLDLEVKKITAYAKLAAGTVAGVTGGDVNTAAQTAQNAVENNAVKAVVTAAKVVYKVARKGLKNGKINVRDLKQTLKDEGYNLADNLTTLFDETLDWNDAKAVIDIVVGTELNRANKGEAAQKVKEVLEKNRPYIPNKGAVPNMSTYMKNNPFGKQLAQISEKTTLPTQQGQSVFLVKRNQGLLKTGDRFYLDGQHKNHLEVFDKNGNFKFVLNMDGSLNQMKTGAAKGRKLNLK
ncbi:S-layer family protein [Neisseria meningitidis]|nr:S-layer family protein [Neisseria meningitidis]ELK98043.1 pre-toxin domain with VENN motif family protein [Neisseria meningitidis 9506]MBG9191274.1 S-layer family protein [Neisseria meningitidis]MBG9207755.1 S-layer family protein [Neisseria meningitidis]MBJ1812852.1 S-layer family protein [Neisseria meningitidis]MBJ1833155.1 S-layer family protein [Neisseria meningitidis]